MNIILFDDQCLLELQDSKRFNQSNDADYQQPDKAYVSLWLKLCASA